MNICNCALTRAIHLEFTKDMRVHPFLIAFRRFCGRKGPVSVMYSDNAQTFRGVLRYIKNIRSDPLVQDLLVSLHCGGILGKNGEDHEGFIETTIQRASFCRLWLARSEPKREGKCDKCEKTVKLIRKRSGGPTPHSSPIVYRRR